MKLSLRTVFYLAVFIKKIPFYLPFPSLDLHQKISSGVRFFLKYLPSLNRRGDSLVDPDL
jgi:hypothetical protein